MSSKNLRIYDSLFQEAFEGLGHEDDMTRFDLTERLKTKRPDILSTEESLVFLGLSSDEFQNSY